METIECPKCGSEINVGNNVPDRACDDGFIDCESCNAQIRFGWVAELEVRGYK